MARSKSPNLTEAELRLMKVLWTLGSGTVTDVVDGLPKDPPVAYSTVLTTLRILENKGYVRHTKEGRAFVYHPLIDQQEARSNVLRYVLDRFFGNSTEALVLNLLENDEIKPTELDRLKKMIQESEA
jgi:predicted transcriptional regulator